MKIGIEVEGRFTGLRTLFLDQREIVDVHKRLDRIATSHWVMIQQIYVTDLKNIIDIWDEKSILKELYDKGFLVTVERTSVMKEHPDYLHIILRIPSASVAFLSGTDQIKFDLVDHVLMATVESFALITDDEYENDVEVPL